MQLIKTNDGYMIQTKTGDYISDAEGNNLFDTIAEAKRVALQDKIAQAGARIDQAIADNMPAYIVRARRNVLAVAHSDLAMLEAFEKLESQ